jgi:dephospho-CoA kinase
MVTVIGITGGIGAGKSSAAAVLAELGAEVIDADKAAHQVYLPDTPAWREIVEAFGEEVLAADRTIDRRKLGPRVFADPNALQTLNGIMHGKIFAYIQGQIACIRRTEAVRPRQAAASPDSEPARAQRVVAVEAAVLLEAGWQALVDQLWVVVAPVEVAIARLRDDRGVSEDQARARIAAQMSNDARIAHADTVIHNAADRDALRDAITAAWRRLGGSQA